jgi:hypothetical protein
MSAIKQVAMEFFEVVVAAIPKLYELFRTVGSRDGFLAALDSTLVVARQKTDVDLAKKHRKKRDGDDTKDTA